MGIVYRVHDRELHKEVALKVMRQASPVHLHALKHEFRSRAGLSHPNLTQLHELIVGEDFCCFTMELLQGQDFLCWVRPEHVWPPRSRRVVAPLPLQAAPRLRDALGQLVRGLRFLHESHLLHRDIKPANVLVTHEGRVVLLDFGLAAEFQDGVLDEGGVGTTGTLPYMSPEQLQGLPLTPASDFYAVGLLLYEALTGVVPFAEDIPELPWGPPSRFVRHRLLQRPADPRELAPELPDDLARLAGALLSLQPHARPDAEAILSVLRPAERRGRGRNWWDEGFPGPFSSHFVGRAAELGLLDQALRDVLTQRRQVTVHVHGPSGMGKSTLVREFLGHHRDVLVLKGRCHPQEFVAYQALDAIIDALAGRLSSMSRQEVRALVPAHAHALTRLFPVLGHIPAFGHARVHAPARSDVELRQQGIEALRELLTRFVALRPVVMWIDDAHWGDPDSADFLAQLLRPPFLPGLLLVLTYRSEERHISPLPRRLLQERDTRGAEVRELALGPLAFWEVGALARQFLGRTSPEEQVLLRSMTGPSEGNPFVVCEVSRHLAVLREQGRGLNPLDRLDVARLVAERTHALPPGPRALVELAAVAGVPREPGVLLGAAGLGEGERPLFTLLGDSFLLRRVGGAHAVAVTTYHDHIREAVLSTLDAAALAQRHRALAQALERAGSEDLEALVVHWREAGEARRAGGYAVRAAQRAAHALAFDHAAELYTQSLALLGDAADRPVLLERLAEAHANRGRGPQAAACYLEAVVASQGDTRAQRASGLRLRAAEQYIKSGRLAEGWAVLSALLEELGVAIPRSRWRAVGGAMWQRLRFLLSFKGARVRAPEGILPEERLRLQALWTAAAGFTLVDHVIADAFFTTYLRRVLEVGDGSSLCQALALEASLEALLPTVRLERHVQKLLTQVEQLARRTGAACDEAWWQIAVATVGFTHGRWREAAEASERAERILRQRCTGVAWERDITALYKGWSLAMLGELRPLGPHLERSLQDARLRGDVFGILESCLGEPMLDWLARGRGAEAWMGARQALAQMGAEHFSTWPGNSFSSSRVSYCLLVALVHTHLYQGQPWWGWHAFTSHARAYERVTPPLRFYTAHWHHMGARAALATAEWLAEGHLRPPGLEVHWNQRTLLEAVRDHARHLARDDSVAMAVPLSELVRAGLARLSGDEDAARRLLASALDGLDRAELGLYREAARYAWGQLQGGAGGRALQARAEAWMEAQGVCDPRTLVATLVPGLGIAPGAQRLRLSNTPEMTSPAPMSWTQVGRSPRTSQPVSAATTGVPLL